MNITSNKENPRKIRFSCVSPVYNEIDNLEAFCKRVTETLDGLDGEAEVILVDDGSCDGSYQRMLELSAADPRIVPLKLSRNFGHQAAITAGLDHAKGEAVIVMDSDLQHPPEFIPEMVQQWENGYSVVYAVRSDRQGDRFVKRLFTSSYYWLLNRASPTDIPSYVGDFRLIDRTALETFKRLRESNRYVRGLFSWIGFPQIGIECPYHDRHSGTPKYTLRKMLKLGADGITSFADTPLWLVLNVAFIAGLVVLAVQITGLDDLSSWAVLVIIIAFIGGVHLCMLGVIGAYIGRIYDEAKQWPIYVVDGNRR